MNMKSLNNGDVPVSWLVAALTERGMSEAEICRRLVWDHERIGREDAAASLENYIWLFESAARDLNEPALGLHVGEVSEARQFGLLGYIADNAATVRDFCILVCHYYEIFSRSFGLSFSKSGEICTFRYSEATVLGTDTRQDIDFTLSLLVSTLRRKMGADWFPRACRFTYERPDDIGEHRRLFGPDLRFGQECNELIFDRSALKIGLRDADPGLLAILRQHADSILAETQQDQSIAQKVRLVLISRLGKQECSAEDAASALNISTRKLQRDLQCEDTSFRSLRNEVILSSAREALEYTNATITEIAERLGYSETSAFDRAFKREEGMSPLQYRKQSLVDLSRNCSAPDSHLSDLSFEGQGAFPAEGW